MRVSSYTSHQLAHDGMNDLKMVDRDLYLNPDAPPSDAKPSVVLGGIVLVCRSTASVQRLQKAPKKVHGQSLGVMRSRWPANQIFRRPWCADFLVMDCN